VLPPPPVGVGVGPATWVSVRVTSPPSGLVEICCIEVPEEEEVAIVVGGTLEVEADETESTLVLLWLVDSAELLDEEEREVLDAAELLAEDAELAELQMGLAITKS